MTLQAPGLSGGVSSSASPLGLQIGSGSRLASTGKIYSPGVLEGTGRNLDIAIDGSGFLEVRLINGGAGYTQDGRLQINAEGKLVTQAGFVLQPEITLPSDLIDINIDPSGLVSGRLGVQYEE